MKNLFNFLMITILITSFSSCSSDDDGGNIVIPQTYLEKYEGTVWVYTDDWLTEYIRIINNETTPFEIWDDFSGNCFNYYLIDFSELSGLVEVTANLEDVFELTITIAEMDIIEITTFRIDGDILILESNYYEGNELTETYIETYERQNIDVDGLTICDD